MLNICNDRALNSGNINGAALKNYPQVHKSVGPLFASGEDSRTRLDQDTAHLCTRITDYNNSNINEDSRSCLHTGYEPLRYNETSLGRRPFMSDGYKTTTNHTSSSFDIEQNRPTTINRQLSVGSFADQLMNSGSPEIRSHNHLQHYREHRLVNEITPTESSSNTNQYELSSVSSTSARESNQISNESNYHNPDSLTGQKKQQHRRLQHQVHQQLQRIYGDKLQAIEQQQQQNCSSIVHETQPMNQNQPRHLGPTNISHASKTRFELNFRHDPNCPRLKRGRLEAQNNLTSQTKHKLSLICPIVEECCQAKRHSNDSFDEYNHCVLMNENKCDVDDDDDDDDDDNDDANIDECDGKNHLHGPTMLKNSVEAQTGSGDVDRKRQLESLHYATATAAALLNATANAAAAFAANEDKLYSSSSGSSKKNLRPNPSNTYQDIMQSNDLLHKVNQPNYRQQSHLERQVQQQEQQQHQINKLYKPFPYEQPPRKHSEAGAIEGSRVRQTNNSIGRMFDRDAQATKVGYGPTSQRAQQAVTLTGPPQAQPMNANLHRDSIQQHLNVAYNFDKLPEHSRPLNQPHLPPPLPKPEMHARRLYQPQQQAQLLRQQQQQYQLQRQFFNHQMLSKQSQAPIQQRFSFTPNAMPTLAILHHKGKGKSLKVDLIGSLPLTQIAAPIKPYPAATTSTSEMPCFAQNNQPSIYTADLRNILAGRLPSRQIANRSMVNVATSGNASICNNNIQALTNTTTACQSKVYQQQNRTSVVTLQAAPIQSSDSIASGRSDMPLVLDKRLGKASIIERICRIDLTAFWWALLIVCMISISLAITIFKQFH